MTTEITPQVDAALRVAAALYAAVKEMGEHGAPAGPMYAAMMPILSRDDFQRIMGVLVKAGLVRHSCNVYYAIPQAPRDKATDKAPVGRQGGIADRT